MTTPLSPITPTGPVELLPAVHNDNWDSPWLLLHRSGEPLPLDEWDVTAQIRDADGGGVLFDFATAGTVVSDSSKARRDNGTEVVLPSIQLRLRPRDWVGAPDRRIAYLEVALTKGDPADPDDRVTIVRRRRLEILGD